MFSINYRCRKGIRDQFEDSLKKWLWTVLRNYKMLEIVLGKYIQCVTSEEV